MHPELAFKPNCSLEMVSCVTAWSPAILCLNEGLRIRVMSCYVAPNVSDQGVYACAQSLSQMEMLVVNEGKGFKLQECD